MNNKKYLRNKPKGFGNNILGGEGISGTQLESGSKMDLNGKEVIVVSQRILKNFTTVSDGEKEFEVETDKLKFIEEPFSNYYLGNFINPDFPMYITGLLTDGIICRNDIEQAKTYNVKYDKIVRIPISEEWLKKLNLVIDKTIDGNNFYRLDNFLVCSVNNEEFYYCKDYENKIQRLFFIDEVQNKLKFSGRIMNFDELPLDVQELVKKASENK